VNRTINTEGPPWPYVGAGTPSSTYERGALFEGGIDATGLGLDLVCAGTFVADTRSSQSPTAQLHDFSIGQVDLCSVSMTTTSSQTGQVKAGSSVTDTATLTQTPAAAPAATGNVTFYLCQPATVTANGGNCSAGGTQVGAVKALSGNPGSATSDATTNTNTAGKYCWRAEYAGNTLYAATTHTNSTTECFTVGLATLTTTSSETGQIKAGSSVTDTATLTQTTGAQAATGNVTFFLCQPATVTANGGDCSAGGAQVGAVKALSGDPGAATSDATTNTNTAGKYCWRAEYAGDTLYAAATHTNSTTECFTVALATMTTTSSQTGTVLAGVSVTDTATLTQTTGAQAATGNVTFYLCQPATVTANGGDCSAGGAQVGAVKALSGNPGSATSDATTNTTAVGKYCWRAEYAGDTLYAAASHTNTTTECFTTFKPTTVISIRDQLIGLPSDATGTVTYGVFTNSNCTTAVTTGVPSNGNITPDPNVVSGSTAPMSDLYTPAAPGTFYIKAVFTGANGSIYEGVVITLCEENAVLTF
jgi:hypothetical protein